jgi:hypothetical protein
VIQKAAPPAPSADRCLDANCPLRSECQLRASTCNPATGKCDVPPFQRDGTACSTGFCWGGVCSGGHAIACIQGGVILDQCCSVQGAIKCTASSPNTLG